MAENTEALSRRNIVIGKIMAQYDAGQPNTVFPVLSLEDYFEFNWDEHSLAPNQVGFGRPALQECHRILRAIRDRPDVQDVLVAICETPYADDEDDFDMWPVSDTVYILSSASDDEVAKWVSSLVPDSIGNAWSCKTGIKPVAAPDLLPGMSVHAVWWD